MKQIVTYAEVSNHLGVVQIHTQFNICERMAVGSLKIYCPEPRPGTVQCGSSGGNS